MKTRMMWCGLAGWLIVLTLATAAQGEIKFRQTDGALALLNDDAVVWQFNYGEDLTKPYFHPLGLWDGTVLTWERPPDHVWHYGLWFCWKFINGANYWEEDPQTGQSEGWTQWDKVEIYTHPNGAAHITMRLSYRRPGEPIDMKEKRTVTMIPITGGYVMEWESGFTAVAEKVQLTRTPIPGEPNSKPYGGYAGLSFRGRKGIEDVRFITTQGPAELLHGGWRGRDVAMEYSGKVEGKEFGMAVLDHPGNLNFPTPWYLTHDQVMDYWGPAVLYHGGYEMAKGESFTLRYRIIVHEGRWDAEELKKQYEQYKSSTTKGVK